MREDKPLEWPVFPRAMETLIALRGPDLLRIKGLLNVAGCRGPGGVPGGAAPDPSAGRTGGLAGRGSRQPLVFITRGVSEQQVRDLFAACKALGYTRRVAQLPGRWWMLSKNNSFQSFGAAIEPTGS